MTDSLQPQKIQPQKIGDYEILSVLGNGGMGKVYKVRNTISDRVEAMKILLPDLIGQKELADRFLREIKVLASLEHPNIAALRTAFTYENQLVMIMEYVEGVTLADRAAQGTIPVADTLKYIDDVLAALSYAHNRGVIHRDIKPANIMLTPAGLVKLMDFGIARSERDPNITATGTTLGSLNYMSPEQIEGGAVDARSDIYSVGVTLYQLITGQTPFKGDSGFAVMSAHMKQVPQRPIELRPDLPPALSEMILMALAKDPARRFQTADAFRNALGTVRSRLIESSSPATSPLSASSPLSAASSTSQPASSSTSQPSSSSSSAPPFAPSSAPSFSSSTPPHSSPSSSPAPPPPSSHTPTPSYTPPIPPPPPYATAPAPSSHTPSSLYPPPPPPATPLPSSPYAPPSPPPPPSALPSPHSYSPSAPTSTLPPPSHRGLYITLGALIVLIALVAAGLTVPKYLRTRADRNSSALPPASSPDANAPSSAHGAASTGGSENASSGSSTGNAGVNSAGQPSTGGAGNSSSGSNPPTTPGSNPAAASSPTAATGSPAVKRSRSAQGYKPQSSDAAGTQGGSSVGGAVSVNQSETGDAAGGAAGSSATGNTAPQVDAAEVAELEKRADQLEARVGAADASLDAMKRQMEAQGLGLRGDIVAARTRMDSDLSKASGAMGTQDYARAKKYLEDGEAQAERIEKFLGR